MNPDPTESRLRELSWRRPLTPAEHAELRAWLATHPEAAARWQEDLALNLVLEQLPPATVPSNFTERVMQELERDAARTERTRPSGRPWWQKVLLPRLATVAVLLGAGLLVYQREQSGVHQMAVGRDDCRSAGDVPLCLLRTRSIRCLHVWVLELCLRYAGAQCGRCCRGESI